MSPSFKICNSNFQRTSICKSNSFSPFFLGNVRTHMLTPSANCAALGMCSVYGAVSSSTVALVGIILVSFRLRESSRRRASHYEFHPFLAAARFVNWIRFSSASVLTSQCRNLRLARVLILPPVTSPPINASAYAHGFLLSRTAKGMMGGGAKFRLNLNESNAADIASQGRSLGHPLA